VTGAVVWFTGLPASGKTTLAVALRSELTARGVASVLLDSDALRPCLHPAPGYDDAGRAAFYATLASLAALFESEGLVVLVAATAHRRAFRAHARANAKRFLEVFVDCDPSVCAARDPKGLYAAARGGELAGLPGVGATYEPPEHPEVHVDARVESAIAVRTILTKLLAPSEGGAP